MTIESSMAVDSALDRGIHVRGLRRTFGSFVAVSDLDLDVPPGRITALVGPNGAGKTTLLLMLASLLAPDKGTIRVAGHDPVTKPRAVRAAIGWSPDVFGVYDNLTAREYIKFFADAYSLDPSKIDTRVSELLALVRLEEFADSQVHVLSRGQKQRLGLTRALINSPKVLMLDEPASGLDPRSRSELRDILAKLAADGATVLVSSHILSDLEEMADRVVFIDKGRNVGQHDMAELGATTTKRQWRLKAIDPMTLTTALAEMQIEHKPGRNGEVTLAVESERAVAELVTQLASRGIGLTLVAPSSGTLEAAYMQVTEDRQ